MRRWRPFWPYLELTQTISISMAAMLAIVTATLTNTSLFGQRSAHQTVLRQLQRVVPNDPLNQLLHSTRCQLHHGSPGGARTGHAGSRRISNHYLKAHPPGAWWNGRAKTSTLVSGDELLEWLQQIPPEADSADVTEAAIRRWTIAPLPVQATLRQAMDTMR